MVHELKIWPQYYQAVYEGTKTFEVRVNDRGFQKGDFVRLREFNPHKPQEYKNGQAIEWNGYTDSPYLEFKIGYVLPIDEERVVFSLIKKEYNENKR